MSEKKVEFFAPKELPVAKIDVTQAFQALSDQEQHYAHFLSEGNQIIL